MVDNMYINMVNIKLLSFLFILLLISSCNSNSSNPNSSQNVNKEDVKELTPGLGEYMIQLEYHHRKIGDAINDSNFKWIDYELDELQEVFEKIEHFHNDHEKLKESFENNKNAYLIPTINLLKSASSRKQKDSCLLYFTKLTNNCNNCHAANHLEFISVK